MYNMTPLMSLPLKGIKEEEMIALETDLNETMKNVESFYRLLEDFDKLSWGKYNVSPDDDKVVIHKLSALKNMILISNTLYEDMEAPLLTLCVRLVEEEINTISDIYYGGFIPHALIPNFKSAISSMGLLIDKYIGADKPRSKVYKKDRDRFNIIRKTKIDNLDLFEN